jgi:Uncharacterised nucleotidyltransferase
MMEATASFSKYDSPRHRKASRGRLVAQLLAGAWRGSALPISAEELAEIANLLTTCGAGGLAWCRVRGSNLRSSPIAELFQAQYRFQSLQAKLHERSLKKVIPLLRSFGAEPLLIKGWAIARFYPEAGMRPYVDLDLCVLPGDQARASAVLTSGECDDCNVDLHIGFGKFYDRRTDDIFARSRLVKLDDLEVRVLSAEDDLRFLCMHLLRHGAFLPLWLCDIAVLLEARSNDFDWDRCLSGSRREADWVACAIGLAHQLLGARVEGIPVARRAQNLPNWLVPSVLQRWGVPLQTLSQIRPLLRQPVSLLRNLPQEIRRHWPNPIEATMTLRGPFNRLPRLPFQVGHVISRTAALLSQLLGDIRSAIPYGS